MFLFIYVREQKHLPMSTACVGHIVPVCISREKTAYLAEFCDSKAVNSVVPKPWSKSDKTSWGLGTSSGFFFFLVCFFVGWFFLVGWWVGFFGAPMHTLDKCWSCSSAHILGMRNLVPPFQNHSQFYNKSIKKPNPNSFNLYFQIHLWITQFLECPAHELLKAFRVLGTGWVTAFRLWREHNLELQFWHQQCNKGLVLSWINKAVDKIKPGQHAFAE